MSRFTRPLLATGLCVLHAQTGRAADLHILGGAPTDPVLVNYTVGADLLWNSGYLGQGVIIANVEAGHFWSGHEVFQRFDAGGAALPAPIFINADPAGSELGEIDFHATMVAHVLAGGSNTAALPDSYTTYGIGMAPRATLWSGAIATSFDKTVENAGSFDISDESFRTPYVAFFTGSNPATGGARADVINSSWGFDDPTYQAAETRTITGLAAQNPSVTAVFSAGNSGYGPDQIGGPASSPNVISVGSLGGAQWLTPSDFSSGGPVAFYHPGTQTLMPGERAAVHISAPGENFFLAAYLQHSGGLEPILVQEGIDEPASDLYFNFTASGTSFSAPVVAGGVGLLKELARDHFSGEANVERLGAALDTRVVRSLIMATSLRTEGWDNGQHTSPGGPLVTTQALDYHTGAGAFDVSRAALVYALGTADVPGLGGGANLQPSGWDFGSVTLGGTNDYFIDLSGVIEPSELAVSLNWFVDDSFDIATGETLYGSFADLDLEIWSVSLGDNPTTVLAACRTPYNNTEFLRFPIAPGGRYALRVRFDQYVYNLDLADNDVGYGLSWATSPIPEPASFTFIAGLAALGFGLRRRPRR
jgi:hypothetical protein